MNEKIQAFKAFLQKFFGWAILGILLLLGGWFFFLEPRENSSPPSPAEEPLFSVEVVSSERGDITSWLHARGTLRPRHASGLTFLVPGVVMSLDQNDAGMPLGEGDAVRGPSTEEPRGQLLAILDSRKYETFLMERRGELAQIEASVREAEAELATAKIDVAFQEQNYRRMQQLHREKAVSTSSFEDAERSYKKLRGTLDILKARIENLKALRQTASARLRQSELDLEQTELRAPFDGILLRRNVHQGTVVDGTEGSSPEEAAFFLLDPSSLEVLVEIPLYNLPHLFRGQSGDLLSRDGSRHLCSARIHSISPMLSEEHRSVRVLLYPNTSDLSSFYSRENLRVRIALEHREKALLLPRDALFQEGDSWSCYVIDPLTERAHRREVLRGIEEGERVEILEGLHPEELVVTQGKSVLYEGARVRVLSSPKEERYSSHDQ